MTKYFTKHTINLIAAFTLSYILHIIPVFLIKLPTSGPDEIGTIAFAAYLAGKDWSYLVSRHGAFYGFGSSWFLAPLIYLIQNPYTLYNVLRYIIALFLCVPTIISYRIMRRFYKFENLKLLFTASVACSLFTNTTADILINEAFLVMGTWLTVYLLLAASYSSKKRHKMLLSFLLAILLSYMATIHTRSVLYFAVVFLIITLYYIFKKKWLVHVPVFAASSSLYFAARYFIKIVRELLYNNINAREVSGSIESLEGTYNNIQQMLNMYGARLSIEAILSLFFSNLYGVIIFSVGMLLPCLVVVCLECRKLFRKQVLEMSVSIPSLFCGIGLLSTIVALSIINIYHGATLYFGNDLGDGRFFFYLRYYINFMPPVLLALIFYIEEGKQKISMLVMSLILMVLTACGFCYFFLRAVYNNHYKAFDVGKLFSAFLFHEPKDFLWYYYIIVGVIIGVFLLFFYILARRKYTWIIMLVLCGLLFYEQIYQCIFFRKPIADTIYDCIDTSSELFVGNELFVDEIDTLYVYSKSTYKLEYAAQLVFKDITVLPYLKEPDEDFLLLSNQTIDKKGYYKAVLDDNEYLYTNSDKIVRCIYRINRDIEFVLQ